MNDSSLSISTKALQPAYGKAELARGLSGRQDAMAAERNSVAQQPASESAQAVAAAQQFNGLAKTQSVLPGDRLEQAANEETQTPSPLGLEKRADGANADEELGQAVESINNYLQSSKRMLEFSVDETSGRTVIKVMDAEREEVIRQIPPETALELMQKLRDGDGVAATGIVERA